MAKVVVKLTESFTTIPNQILRNKNMSLKAKGLLITMLSLPEDWNYTVEGLSTIVKEGRDSVRSALKEIEENGYLTRERSRQSDGTLSDMIYMIYDFPVEKEPITENPTLEKATQLNTNIIKNRLYTSSNDDGEYTSPDGEDVPKTENEREADVEHISEVVNRKLEVDYGMPKNSETHKDIMDVINLFLGKYQEKFGKSHREMTNKAYENIVDRYLTIPDTLHSCGIYTFDEYEKMIDAYFDTNFNSRCSYNGEISLSLSHFFSDNIRGLLYERAV